ncbi:hypothetical protein RN001_000798 [Aquatica leii]|uniref:CN hydrolase domain-containing protein n=1 Tax=Aquatica leii TaxID=1421715 RepID=A0AAN7Q7F4_9COLE|nr:hypothetical protein RN001_000798 [Aquatica leii]
MNNAFFYLFMLSVHFGCIFSIRDSYKAAVIEHSPANTGNIHISLATNLRLYLEYVEQAAYQDVEIIVFPEDGLIGRNVRASDLPHISTVVPDPKDHISPCLDRSGSYASFLTELSCASKRHQIYAVVNLVESVSNNGKYAVYHKTNVVFDRSGVVISRYREINTHDEINYVPGPDTIAAFSTDFGVTFGILISYDIIFKTPALDLLQNENITDIVYSSAWVGQLPFYASNSIQHGFSKSSGINLLAAGLNDPANGNGGSGIYLADGRLLSTYVSGGKTSKLIINNVPKLKLRYDVSNICQGSSTFPIQPMNVEIPDIRLFYTLPTDLTNYTVKSLDLKNQKVFETICTSSDFCCSFNISVNKYSPIWPNYNYKLVIYDGVSAVSSTKSIGLRNCALVACANDSVESCGERNTVPPTGINFLDISILGTFDKNNANYMPITTTYDLIPSTQYAFCQKTKKDEVDIIMYTTQEHDSLLTFDRKSVVGFVGYCDDNDGYRVWIDVKDEVILRRNVVFKEECLIKEKLDVCASEEPDKECLETLVMLKKECKSEVAS